MTIFKNRKEAGRLLAAHLEEFRGKALIILAIPRGGIVIGREVAMALGAPLDIVVTRKIGAPSQPEFAIGAITQDGNLILDEESSRMVGASAAYLRSESQRQFKEVKARLKRYREGRPYPPLKGKLVVIVDDGIATGHTVKAAIMSVRRHEPLSVVVAVPVAPGESIAQISRDADKVICLQTPEPFFAIGEFYEDFEQVTDDEVRDTLRDLGKST
jgi:predicted phosphoribosyltransferase